MTDAVKPPDGQNGLTIDALLPIVLKVIKFYHFCVFLATSTGQSCSAVWRLFFVVWSCMLFSCHYSQQTNSPNVTTWPQSGRGVVVRFPPERNYVFGLLYHLLLLTKLACGDWSSLHYSQTRGAAPRKSRSQPSVARFISFLPLSELATGVFFGIFWLLKVIIVHFGSCHFSRKRGCGACSRSAW